MIVQMSQQNKDMFVSDPVHAQHVRGWLTLASASLVSLSVVHALCTVQQPHTRCNCVNTVPRRYLSTGTTLAVQYCTSGDTLAMRLYNTGSKKMQYTQNHVGIGHWLQYCRYTTVPAGVHWTCQYILHERRNQREPRGDMKQPLQYDPHTTEIG